MATVQLSDIFIKKVYQSIVPKNNTQRLALLNSGLLVRNAEFDAIAGQSTKEVEVPVWNDLATDGEPNYSNDNPDSRATPQKVNTTSMKARTAFMNNSWSATDLAVELGRNVGDPMTRIKTRTTNYWDIQRQKRLIACSKGILAKNVASNNGDMLFNAAIADGDQAEAANLISRSAVVEAVFTLGDRFDDIRAMAMHSVVYQRLVDQQQIEFIQPAGVDLMIPTYLGKRVIVDDACPAVAGGTSGFIYTTILFGAGCFGYGEGNPPNPVEVWRDPQAANGAGLEVLIERCTWLLHPTGHNFTSATLSGGAVDNANPVSATLADLALAANWTRVMDRKHIPLAFLKTNG